MRKALQLKTLLLRKSSVSFDVEITKKLRKLQHRVKNTFLRKNFILHNFFLRFLQFFSYPFYCRLTTGDVQYHLCTVDSKPGMHVDGVWNSAALTVWPYSAHFVVFLALHS